MKTIKIYTKDYCPFCTKAKNTMKNQGWEFEEIHIGNDPAIYAELKEKTGHMTVPQIFVGDEFIGGSDDLDRRLDEVKAMMAA